MISPLLFTILVAADPGAPIQDAAVAEELARILRGKTVIVRDSVLNIDDITIVPTPPPELTTYELRARVSPLFEIKDLKPTYHENRAEGVAHYTLQLNKKCGTAASYVVPGRDVVIDAANTLILDGDRFRWLGELATPELKKRVELYVNPQQLLAANDRARVKECAQQRARAATDASHLLSMYVGYEQRLAVRIGVDPRVVQADGDVGEDWLPLRFVISKPDGIVIERQSVTIMACSNEGPHVELYDWKQGVTPWKPLTRRRPPTADETAAEFLVSDDPFADKAAFPAYTPAELNKNKPSDYPIESCSPSVGIVRFRVRFGTETLQTIEIRPAMGC